GGGRRAQEWSRGVLSFRQSPERRVLQAREQRRVELGRRRFLAGDPSEHLGIGGVEETLELVEFSLAHRRKIGVGELAHHQVHLAHAPPPGAKQNPSPPLIERGAAQHRAGHEGPFSNRNAGAAASVPPYASTGLRRRSFERPYSGASR